MLIGVILADICSLTVSLVFKPHIFKLVQCEIDVSFHSNVIFINGIMLADC